jgi:hypothetical protein
MTYDYNIEVDCDTSTSDYLTNGGFSLVTWKGVSSATKGQPTVWFTYSNIGSKNTVSWNESFQCYSSTSKIVPNGVIATSNPYAIGFNQTFAITNGKSGTGTVTTGGGDTCMTIDGCEGFEWTVGLSQKVGTNFNPLCAFDCAGDTEIKIVPIEKVLLTFMTGTINTGTVYYTATTSGMLVDVTAHVGGTLIVSYDKNTGWTCADSMSQSIAKGANLSKLLITQPSPSSLKRLSLKHRETV